MTPPIKFRVRAGQREFERGVREHRLTACLARRQYGKTTIASRISLEKMMRTPGHTVIFGSVKLDLGREIVRKEAEAIQKSIRALVAQAAESSTLLDVVDTQGGKSAAKLNPDDFADLYESTRLEFRLHHDRTTYSRTKVVALTPAAVGETGDLILDEVGRVKAFREVWEAVRPIIASNPDFRCMLTTTPPPDDSHYSFELLAPPIGTEFKPNPTGNWYRSEFGVWVLRIDAWDAYADGVPLYDDETGKAISPDEARAQDHDKDAWDRNYGVKFVLGGAAAVGLLQLDAAQRRGVGKCRLFQIETDDDVAAALDFLVEHLGPGRVGVGVDWATTDGATSNPTSITVLEEVGAEYVAPVTLVWKTRDPDLAIRRLTQVVEAVNARPAGGRARRVCQDASSEKYHCVNVRRELAHLVPVEDVVAGETVDQPGGEPITKKAILGNDLVGILDDNRLTTAPERYLKTDFRLVKRDRGSFTTDLGAAGEHGDTFDSHKFALRALTSSDGGLETTEGIRMGTGLRVGRPVFTPRRLA